MPSRNEQGTDARNEIKPTSWLPISKEWYIRRNIRRTIFINKSQMLKNNDGCVYLQNKINLNVICFWEMFDLQGNIKLKINFDMIAIMLNISINGMNLNKISFAAI